MRLRLVSSMAGLAFSAALLLASPASGATLIGDYQFQGTRASSGPGPALTDVGGTNSFQTDNVFGTTRQVLARPDHSGVQMSPSVGSGDVPYSVVTTFRLDILTQYRRLLDPSPGTLDEGFYEYEGAGSIYGIGEARDGKVVFANGAYATAVLESSPPSESRFYVNGARILTLNETFPVVADTLRFFKDDGVEDSAGAVSCIRVFSGTLTDAEVAAIGASPTCGAPAPSPAAKKKKCKKKKKKGKGKAAAKKKKKCKKKKKKK